MPWTGGRVDELALRDADVQRKKMPVQEERMENTHCIASALRFSAFVGPALCGVLVVVVRTLAGTTGLGTRCIGGFCQSKR